MSGHLVLASGSPRRLTLLRSAGFEPEVRVPPVDETPLAGEDPSAMVQRLALAKLHSVVVAGETGLAADTAVVVDGEGLGKPLVPDRAQQMLRLLSGRTHEVVGGIAVRHGGRDAVGVVTTRVSFRELSDDEIRVYVASGEPLDKAGGYAIQGGGGRLVTEVDGCRDNVIGLSLGAALELFSILGFQPPSRPGGSSL
ncbi:MAG: nucleoside triphosphate pyrophosphatase [Acidimicrobiales bacterium]|nr:nucleoside triphosphate pyrophosphatase [Acidimicrobiales bacterium]